MAEIAPQGELVLRQKECLICARPSLCRNYGVTSCDACKMFFRRTIVEKLWYVCKKDTRCMEQVTVQTKPLCKGCRLQKCLELGMEFFPKSFGILEVGNLSNEDFLRVLRDLTAMSSSWYLTLLNFYTEEDPGLEDILEGRKAVAIKKPSNQRITPTQWSFFAKYILVSAFTNFSCVHKLTSPDKIVLFRASALKCCLFASAMKSLKERRERPLTPDGQEVYPERLPMLLNIDPQIMTRLCTRLTSRMIELNVSSEEFILLLLIFFCNPAIPSLSDRGRSVLATDQKMYTSALFQLCQIKHQHAAPSRLTDLLSLYQVINKSHEDLLYITMVFKFYVPNFKFHKLITDLKT